MQFQVIGRVKKLIPQLAIGLLILAPMIAQAMDFATFSNACAQNGYGAAIIGGVYKCTVRNGGGGAQPNYNAIYQQQQAAAAAAAAEEQRKKDAELEQQRIDAENNRRLEEIAKHKKFVDERNAAASSLRGSSGAGLRGNGATADQDATVLRGAGSFGSDVVRLKGSGNADAPIRNGSSSDPGSQANSVLHHGTTALGENADGAHSQAGKGFDTLGENRGRMAIRPDEPDRRSAALAAKIPDKAWKDPVIGPQIGQLYGNYKNLSAIKDETLSSIAHIKELQKSGKEDSAVMSAQLSALNIKLKEANQDMDKTERKIKDDVTNLGLSFNEGATASAAVQTTGEKK